MIGFDAGSVDFSKGLVPAVVRDDTNGALLMLAYVNEEALARMVQTGETWFWSRSRNELWNKGATSGNRQLVQRIRKDCDSDSLLIDVIPSGPSCHTGASSCFGDEPDIRLQPLLALLRDRKEKRPEGSYTSGLFTKGRGKILKKIGEEATEVVIASTSETRERVVEEVSDLVFHLTVLLANEGIEWSEIAAELAKRKK